jgi:hypothetical protein
MGSSKGLAMDAITGNSTVRPTGNRMGLNMGRSMDFEMDRRMGGHSNDSLASSSTLSMASWWPASRGSRHRWSPSITPKTC